MYRWLEAAATTNIHGGSGFYLHPDELNRAAAILNESANLVVEAISKNGFWLKIEAQLSFPAPRDFPSDPIFPVGHNPQEYIGISRS